MDGKVCVTLYVPRGKAIARGQTRYGYLTRALTRDELRSLTPDQRVRLASYDQPPVVEVYSLRSPSARVLARLRKVLDGGAVTARKDHAQACLVELERLEARARRRAQRRGQREAMVFTQNEQARLQRERAEAEAREVEIAQLLAAPIEDWVVVISHPWGEPCDLTDVVKRHEKDPRIAARVPAAQALADARNAAAADHRAESWSGYDRLVKAKRATEACALRLVDESPGGSFVVYGDGWKDRWSSSAATNHAGLDQRDLLIRHLAATAQPDHVAAELRDAVVRRDGDPYAYHAVVFRYVVDGRTIAESAAMVRAKEA